MLLSTLILTAIAAARWHSARGHAQQAAAARQTAQHLRAAYRRAANAPLQTLRSQGRALPEAQRSSLEATIRAVLPETASDPSDERKHDALDATLAQAERAGHDPQALLRRAIDMRELDTADDVNDVLIWRLRRLADLPANPGGAPRPATTGTARPTATPRRTSVHGAPPAAPRPVPPDSRDRPPRR